jgi:hypothetical protein
LIVRMEQSRDRPHTRPARIPQDLHHSGLALLCEDVPRALDRCRPIRPERKS